MVWTDLLCLMLTCGEASGCGSGWAAALRLRLGFTVVSSAGVVVACIAEHCISRWLEMYCDGARVGHTK